MITYELIRTCDLAQPVQQETLRHPIFAGDSQAHCAAVTVLRAGEPVDLTGCTATGYFVRADGGTVIVPATVDGAVSAVWLPACYEMPGRFTFILRLTDANGVRATILALSGSVAAASTDAVVDTAHVLPSLDDLLASVAALEDVSARAEALYLEILTARETGQLTGRGLTILGYFDAPAGLSAITHPQPGDAYCVGAQAPYSVYIWDGRNGVWVNNGSLQSETLSVNGKQPVSGNVTLTADDIPSGSSTVAADLTAAAARCTPTLLWEGSWSSGSITVPGISQWHLLQVHTGVGPVCCTVGSDAAQGIGASLNASIHRTIGVRFTVSENVCTMTTAHYVNHAANGVHGDLSATAVNAIRGLLKKGA